MKVRSSFVSNSSSSSFIVIGHSPESTPPNLHVVGGELVVGDRGTTEFGWGPDKLTDFYSRLNLCVVALQYDSCGSYEEEMLLKVIQKRNPEIQSIRTEWGPYDGYIDHQSVDEMTEMYKSEESLEAFLFNKDSYIVLDNDNH